MGPLYPRMRILIVFCHPYEASYGAAVLERAQSSLQRNGHELKVIDLYREGFDPVLSRDEWLRYMSEPEKNREALQEHVDALLWAEGLVMIFPTWMYGPPSMLKGWMERVWLPGVAFDVAPQRRAGLIGRLHNIKQFTVITTSGSPRWWLWLIRNPGRNAFMRGQKPLFHPKCRMQWLQIFDMDHTTQQERQRFLDKVEGELGKLHQASK